MNWVEQTNQAGYAVIPAVVWHPELDALINSINKAELPRSRAGVRHVMGHPQISQIARDETLLQFAKTILGENAIPFRATLFDKSPASNWLVAWHQDTALPLEEKTEAAGWGPWSVKDGLTYAHAPAEALEKVLALRLHLDDSTLENGPLRVLPGTHQGGIYTDEQLHKLSEQVHSVDCTVGRGGLILMRPLVAHASSKSTSYEPRRVIHIEYASQREILPDKTLAIA